MITGFCGHRGDRRVIANRRGTATSNSILRCLVRKKGLGNDQLKCFYTNARSLRSRNEGTAKEGAGNRE